MRTCLKVHRIIINEYPEAGLTASISVQHIYYKHEFQQKNFANTIVILLVLLLHWRPGSAQNHCRENLAYRLHHFQTV